MVSTGWVYSGTGIRVVGATRELGKGYVKQGLRLLMEQAFRNDHVSRLHNDFEITRDAAYHIHKFMGFREINTGDGNVQLEITREEYLQSNNRLFQ